MSIKHGTIILAFHNHASFIKWDNESQNNNKEQPTQSMNWLVTCMQVVANYVHSYHWMIITCVTLSCARLYGNKSTSHWQKVGVCIVHRSIKFGITTQFQTTCAHYTQNFTVICFTSISEVILVCGRQIMTQQDLIRDILHMIWV